MREMNPRRLPSGLSFVGLVLLVVAGMIGLPSHFTWAAASPAPAIQITPNQGHIHDLVVITGQGFGPNEQVSIIWGTHPFFAGQTDANGNFTMAPHPVQWYAAYPQHTIKGTGRKSGLSATTTFTVLP
jgi:hypothetical protein